MSENQAHRQEDKKDVLGSLSWSSFAVSLWFGGTSKRQGHESSELEDKTSIYSQISWAVNRYRMLYCNDSAICLWNLGGIVFDVWMYSNLHVIMKSLPDFSEMNTAYILLLAACNEPYRMQPLKPWQIHSFSEAFPVTQRMELNDVKH